MRGHAVGSITRAMATRRNARSTRDDFRRIGGIFSRGTTSGPTGATSFLTFRGLLCFWDINIVTMKILILPSLLAALAALTRTFLQFEPAVSLLVSAGLLATRFADDARAVSASASNRFEPGGFSEARRLPAGARDEVTRRVLASAE